MVPQGQAPHGQATRGALDRHTPRDRHALFIRATWGISVHTADELLDPVRFSYVHVTGIVEDTLFKEIDGRTLLGEHLK